MNSAISGCAMSKSDPIVFFSKMPQAVPSMGPVQALAGGVFVSNRRSTVRFFRQCYPSLSYLRFRSFLGPFQSAHRHLSAARVLVSGAGHRAYLDRYEGVKAMIFHGTYRELSPEAVSNISGFDHVFLNGPRMERMLLRCEGQFSFSYSVCGYVPFVEFPEATPESRQRILGKLGLDAGQPTVFYAPARRNCGSWVACAEAIARGVPAHCNLVMRPHPSQVFTHKNSERQLLRRLRQIMNERQNAIIDLAVCSFPELLCAADLLIGDGTSPNEEFLFYDRPHVIIETTPQDAVRRKLQNQGMHPDDVEELMALYACAETYVCEEAIDWPLVVEGCLAEPGAKAAVRKACFESAFGPDVRGAAGRIATELKAMCQ
jgi:hypothetical protein